MERKRKVLSLSEAANHIKDGMMLGIGGWLSENVPMALIREVIKSGVKNLTLVSGPQSIGADIMIGAGCLKTLYMVFISFEDLGFAPNFRYAAQNQLLDIKELDGPGLVAGLHAGIRRLPFMPIFDLGTDIYKVNPEFYRPLENPVGDEKLLMVPAIRPDISIVHAQRADEYGNLQYFGASFFDPLLVKASKKVIATADKISDYEIVKQDFRSTRFPGYFIEGVAEAPFGAHPCGSHTKYVRDDRHLTQYIQKAKDRDLFNKYVREYVLCVDHAGYLNRIGLMNLLNLEI